MGDRFRFASFPLVWTRWRMVRSIARMETTQNTHPGTDLGEAETGPPRRGFFRVSAVMILGGIALLCKAFAEFLGWAPSPSGPAPFTLSIPDRFPFFIRETWIGRDDRGFFAFSGICPHLGCQPIWVEDVRQFHCPCHRSVFAVDGSRISGPAPRGMDHVLLKRTTGDTLFVDPSIVVPADRRIPLNA